MAGLTLLVLPVAMRVVVAMAGRSGADLAGRFGGQRDDRAGDAGRRLDGRFGPGAHRLHRLRPVGIDDDGEKDLAVPNGEAGNGAGFRQRRFSVRAGNSGQRRHHLVARRHLVAPSTRAGRMPRGGASR